MSRKKIKTEAPKRCAACGLDVGFLQNLRDRARDQGVSTEFAKALAKEHGLSVGRNDFELDHEDPLWAGGEDDKGNIRWLCQGCHKAKTSREAGDRAKRKRLEPRKTARCPDGHEWTRNGKPKWKQKLNASAVQRCWNCPTEKC